jgi:hypothetical protein
MAPPALPCAHKVDPHSPADGEARMLSRCGLRRDQITDYSIKPCWVGQIINHEGRECVGEIQPDKALLLDGGTQIQAPPLQSLIKTIQVSLGHNRDNRIPGIQSGCDEMSKSDYEGCVIRIGFSRVAALNHHSS